MMWIFMHEHMSPEALGFLPSFFSEDDQRSAKEQLNANYVAGWNKFDGFDFNNDTWVLTYPGDPPMKPLAMAKLRNETLLFYEHEWLVIVDEHGQWEAARVD